MLGKATTQIMRRRRVFHRNVETMGCEASAWRCPYLRAGCTTRQCRLRGRDPVRRVEPAIEIGQGAGRKRSLACGAALLALDAVAGRVARGLLDGREQAEIDVHRLERAGAPIAIH